jgi:ABC-type multidrug transport system ATPase subunit
MGADATPLLQLDALAAGYAGRRVFEGYSREFPAGAYVVLGANGSGKSTLLKAVAGVVPIAHGRVLVAGADLERQPLVAKRALSYVPSDPGAYPFMTGAELSRLVCAAKGLPLRPQFDQLASRFAMVEDVHKRFADMSAGMRRKAFLIAALLGASAVLLLDEPSDAIDAAAREALVDLLQARCASSVVLIATHDLDLASRLDAQRIAWPP